MKSRYATGLIVLLMVPIFLFSQGRRGEANALLDNLEQKKEDREKVECFLELSMIFRQIDKDSSLLFADNAYALAADLGYLEGMADALYKKSLTLDAMGDIIDAKQACRECLAIADSINDSIRMGKAYYQLSSIVSDFGETEQAYEYLMKALEIFQAKQDTSAFIAIYNALGSYYDDLSIFDSAAFYYHKSIYLAEAINWTGQLGRIIGNLGKVYDYMDDIENARKYLLISLSYDLASDDINNLGHTYTRLGNVERDIPDYDKAMKYYMLADSVYRVAGDKNGVSEVYVNRSIIYNQQARYDQAIALLHQALQYFRPQGYTDGILAAWLNLSESYAKKGLSELAMAYYDSCENLSIQTNNPMRLKGVYKDKYSFYLDRGNHEKALSAYLKYDKLEDSIFNLEKTELINSLLFKYEKEKDQIRILNLENENLQKARQRNILLMTFGSIVVLGIFLTLFLIYKHRKNRIIADQKIQQLEEEKKHMAARFLVEGEERERKRVAMELHDNLGVLLSATKMQFSEIHDKDPANKELIEKASKYIEQASTDVRKISHNLMPGLLTKLGLFEALEELFENLGDTDKLEAYFEVVGPKNRLPENTEIMLYRIVQEMVNNTLKHAEADSIDMTMVVQPDEVNISYSDNGKGFNVDEVLKKKTLGMQNIQSRVKFMDGMMNIDSNGHGAVYRICIPLTPGSCETSE